MQQLLETMRVDGSQPDDDRIEPLRAQNVAAFTALVEQYQAVVLGLCRSMGLRGADSDDAAAEVFAAVFRGLPKFAGRSKLETWIYRIACRTILRFRKRLPLVHAKIRRQTEELHDREDCSSPRIDEAMQAAELRESVWNAVARLEPRQALVVELHYRRDWPLQQIAEVLDCPIGTVKTLLFRAREELRPVFKRQEIACD